MQINGKKNKTTRIRRHIDPLVTQLGTLDMDQRAIVHFLVSDWGYSLEEALADWSSHSIIQSGYSEYMEAQDDEFGENEFTRGEYTYFFEYSGASWVIELYEPYFGRNARNE